MRFARRVKPSRGVLTSELVSTLVWVFDKDNRWVAKKHNPIIEIPAIAASLIGMTGHCACI